MTLDSPIDINTGEDLPALYRPPASALPPQKAVEVSSLCAIYARYSTTGQRETSIERQVADCKLYIADKRLKLVDCYEDRGVSGTTDEREQLERLRDDARRGRFTHVVIESLDRLARRLSIALKIFEELLDLDIVLHDVEENRALTIIDIGHKGASAQSARDLLVNRNQKGKRRNAALGTFGIASCFGYERYWDGKEQSVRWRKNEKEAALIVEAFELCASGVSIQRILDIFNARPEAERGGKRWTRNFLVGNRRFANGVLRRLRYRGVRIHGRTKIERNKDKTKNRKWNISVHPLSHWVTGKLDPSLLIVTKELFDRVQAVLNERSEAAAAMRAIPRYTSKHAPLRGLIKCAHCGGNITPTLKRKESKPRLLCNKARTKNGCTNTHSFTLGAVEDEIHRLLVENLGTADALVPYVTAYNDAVHERLKNADDKIEELEVSRCNIIRRMDRIREDEESQRYPRDYLENARLKLNVEYTKVEKRLAELAALAREYKKGVDPVERTEAHRMLLASLADVFSDSFEATSETGTKVVAALRRLIHSVIVDIDQTGCSIELKCRIVSEHDDSEQNLAVFSSRLEREVRTWRASVREVRRVAELADAGHRSVTDGEWEKIAHLVPDSVARSRRGNVTVDKRNIVNAAFLHLWEGVPLLHMPSSFGPSEAVFAGLKRLSESGGWDAVADALHKISPERIPDVKSNMFSTDRRSPSSSLKGLPLIKAKYGISATAGEHAPTDAVWNAVKKLIPEQALQINKEPAPVDPRTFLHGFLFWLNKGIPMPHLPLMFGSLKFFNHALSRLANHGHLDELVKTLQDMTPSPLEGADLSRLDRFPRATKERTVWRRALPKQSDVDGIPEHFPDDKTWSLVQHLFPTELLFLKDQLAMVSPQRLAHAILYRAREKIPFAIMPAHFGDPEKVQLIVKKWVFHHLWDEFKRILNEHAPEVLRNADLKVFDRYRRGRLTRYRDLINAERLPAPPHEPTSADFAFFKDLIPEVVLCIRGGPAIMTPTKFFHAIVFMLKERTMFGGLPAYFGDNYDTRVVMRKFVRHHLWDTMRARIEHFEPQWAKGVDLTLFDTLAKSISAEPGFRRRKVNSPKQRQKRQ